MPVARPVTRPVLLFTVARVGVWLVQLPPLPVVLMVMVAPTQTTNGPERVPASGAGFTNTVLVATCVPQAFTLV